MMFDKMKQLMEMKKQADQVKRELDSLEVECNEVRGIKITVNGSQELKSIEIDESTFNAGRDRLQTDLLKSVNAAIQKSQVLAAQKMKSVLPGFPGL